MDTEQNLSNSSIIAQNNPHAFPRSNLNAFDDIGIIIDVLLI